MSEAIGRSFGALRTSILLPITLGVVLFLIGSLLIDGFASIRSVRAVLVLAAFVGLASVGQTLVVVLGGIDLSIPFLVGVANVVGAKAFEAGLPSPVAIGLTVGLTTLIVPCKRVHLAPVLGASPQSSRWASGPCRWRRSTGDRRVPVGIGGPSGSRGSCPSCHDGPHPGAPHRAVLGGPSRSPSWSRNGRRSTAGGCSPWRQPACRGLALIRPLRMWVATFAVSGRSRASRGPLPGLHGTRPRGPWVTRWLFQTIAAVVIGGTSLIGGLGGYSRTALGAIVLLLLSTILLGVGVPSSLIQSALGLLIIVLVSVYGREPRVRDTI